MTRGSGAPASAGINSFRTNGFSNDGLSLTNTDYFQFTIKANAGYKVSLSSILARLKGDPTFTEDPGVNQQFAYSLDGTNFTFLGANVITPTNSNGEVDLPEQVTSGESDLQNVKSNKTITMRYYASGQTVNGGWGFYSVDNTPNNSGLIISGTVSEAVAPNFNATFPLADQIDQNNFNLYSNLDDKGNTYYVVLIDGSPAPTALQVRQGREADGDIATISGSLNNALPNTTYMRNITGLVAKQAYDVYVIAEDDAGNLQASATRIDIITPQTPLPVELISFTGKVLEKSIMLNWSTASEKNNNYFNIERSADGKTFSVVHKAMGAGNSDIRRDYNYLDENPYGGTNYYRLVQFDYNGKSTASKIISVESKINDVDVNIYATINELKLFVNSPNSGKAKIEIFDIQGRKLKDNDYSIEKGFNTIDLMMNLSSGIHLIKYNVDGKFIVKKFKI